MFLSTLQLESNRDLRVANQELAHLTLDSFLTWALSIFGEEMAQVTSFGPAGIVVLDHLARLHPGIRVITIDTNFLFPETYQLWEEIERRYAITLEVRRAATTPAMQTEYYGPRLWELEPDVCCHVRKVTPLADALTGLRAWIAGLRRDQSTSRAGTMLVDWDHRHGLYKLNPLAMWPKARVWHYLRTHDLPYNKLHDQGYASVGCTHCTRPAVDDDERAGRWQGQVKSECGLHLGTRPWGSCPE